MHAALICAGQRWLLLPPAVDPVPRFDKQLPEGVAAARQPAARVDAKPDVGVQEHQGLAARREQRLRVSQQG